MQRSVDACGSAALHVDCELSGVGTCLPLACVHTQAGTCACMDACAHTQHTSTRTHARTQRVRACAHLDACAFAHTPVQMRAQTTGVCIHDLASSQPASAFILAWMDDGAESARLLLLACASLVGLDGAAEGADRSAGIGAPSALARTRTCGWHSDARPRKLRQARTHDRRCRCVSV